MKEPEFIEAIRGQSRRKLRRQIGLIAIGALVGGALWAVQGPIGAFARGEITWQGEPRYEPAHRVSDDDRARIPWTEVHAHLLPAWMMARSAPISADDPQAHLRAHETYTELRYALGPDRNLVELFDELELHLRTDPIGRAQRVDYLLWAYNEYLDRHNVGWRVEASLTLRRDRTPRFMTTSYDVLEDIRNDEGHRLRMLRRADLTNVREGYLGHSSSRDDGALVMIDQVLDFTVRQIWPMLHPGLDGRLSAASRRLAPFVRQEVSGAMAPDLLALLNETAVDQMSLIEVAESIHARATCGSSFRVWGLPWNGLAPPDQRALVEALDRSKGAECPEVTLTEAALLIGASERLGSTPELAQAVEELVTWVARVVSHHEIRHVVDQAGYGCVGCPAGMSKAAQDELSAYVSSFAAPGLGYAALLQACTLEPAGIRFGYDPHRDALEVALEALLEDGCAGPTPDDLYERAASLEQRLFGEREPATLPQ